MPKKKDRKSTLHVRGTVTSFNVSPTGSVEGILVETEEGTVQVNFDKGDTEFVGQSMAPGKVVEIAVELDTDRGDHPVYVIANEAKEVHGVVTRLNYSLRGEVNGCHLSDGTYVHLKPGRAKKHKLRVGDSVRATGACHTGPDVVVLYAQKIDKE